MNATLREVVHEIILHELNFIEVTENCVKNFLSNQSNFKTTKEVRKEIATEANRLLEDISTNISIY